uniref:chromate transporter n=1 Tax=Treponema sp. TaxID=166 RepID=UPI00388F4185
MTRIKMILNLYWSFLKIGGLTFGGGLTMLPMLEHELVKKNKWITEEELLDCYAIGQCTPGIIAVNTATFVGYKKEKVLGGIFATLGMITPSLVIITVAAMFLQLIMG